jgi:hypothetical protein
MTELSRAQLLARGARGGVALVSGGAVLALAAPAAAADPPGEGDLAVVRLAASAELLAEAFYNGCITAKTFEPDERDYLVDARRNEREHYAALAAVLGTGAPVASDFQFAFPPRVFATRRSAAKLGAGLESAFVGAYLGAVQALQSAELRSVAAQIATSEAQHLSVMAGIAGRSPIGPSFPAAFDVEQASAALEPSLGE